MQLSRKGKLGTLSYTYKIIFKSTVQYPAGFFFKCRHLLAAIAVDKIKQSSQGPWSSYHQEFIYPHSHARFNWTFAHCAKWNSYIELISLQEMGPCLPRGYCRYSVNLIRKI